ncbi:MAG: flippase-like domain-containing protein [Leptolinea sp.]|nr:flippase-like domain-containing protein [Leptolinea sp.]
MDSFEKPIVKKAIHILRIIVPVVLLGLLFFKVDFNTFISHLKTYPLELVLYASICIIIANLLFAFRWKYILNSIGISVTFFKLVRLVFFSLFLSNFLPSSVGGDLVKIVGILNETDNAKKDLKVTSVFVDRVFSMASKILLLPLAIPFLQKNMNDISKVSEVGYLLFSFIPEKWTRRARNYVIAIKPWFSVKKITGILALSWLSLFFTITGYWLVAQPFGIPIRFDQVLCMSIITYFAIILPISINGYGVQEGSYIYLFTLLNFNYDQAWTIALIYRLISIIISLLGGLWMLIDGRELFSLLRNQSEEVIIEPIVE